MTSDGVSSSSRVGWMPAEQVTGLEINLDADQCRVLDLGLHVIEVSPKPVPNIRRYEDWARVLPSADEVAGIAHRRP